MSDSSLSLPDDLDLCHQMIRELTETLHQSEAERLQLSQRLDAVLRQLYGRKSEKVDPNQRLLFDEADARPDEPTSASQEQTEQESASSKRRRKKGRHPHGRSVIPPDVPRHRIEHDLPEDQKRCPCCNKMRNKIGEQISEQYDYEQSSLYANQHVRFTYACPDCDEQVQRAELPPQPIDKGLAGPGLLAQVIVSKFVDHLPLYRQERIFSRFDVFLSRSTLSQWMKQCAALLEPLVELMRERILHSRVIGADETPIRVLSRGCQLGRFWLYRGEEANPYCYFEYRPDKSRDGPEAFFADYEGYVQVDAASSYDPVLAKHPIVEVGCWAHVRRKFFDSRTSEPMRAHEALGRIRQLYAIEQKGKNLSEEARYELRQAEAVPLLGSLKSWLLEEQERSLPKLSYGQALTYVLNQWEALCRYTEAGYLSIDNNAVERAIRPVALGRKNYLFVGNEEGGKTAAVLYSVVSSCGRCGVEPFAYLRDVLVRMRTTPVESLGELLPDVWKESRAKT